MHRITTIIPTYNRPKLLKRAVESVLNQTYQDIQVRVYDDCSSIETKRTVEKIIEKNPRVKYYRNEKNIGSIGNIQHGIKQVDSEFFSILSDDDVLLPDFYKKAINELENHPDSMFFAGSCITMDDKGKVLSAPMKNWLHEGEYSRAAGFFRFIGGGHPNWISLLFRKEVTDTVGFLDSEVGASIDLDYELRAASRHSFVVSKMPCAIFIEHETSNSLIAGSERVWPGWLKLIKNFEENPLLSETQREEGKKLLEEQLEGLLFGIWIRNMYLKNFEDSYKIADIFKLELGLKKKALMVRTITALGRYFPPTYCFLWGLVFLRKFTRRKQDRLLQEEYGKLAQNSFF